MRLARDLLKAVYKPAIWAEIHLFHHIAERNELADVDRWLVLKILRRRIQVEEVDTAPEALCVRYHCRAKG